MDDIVKRLTTGYAAPGVRIYYSGPETLFEAHPICKEAAAEITRLRAKVAKADALADGILRSDTWKEIDKSITAYRETDT